MDKIFKALEIRKYACTCMYFNIEEQIYAWCGKSFVIPSGKRSCKFVAAEKLEKDSPFFCKDSRISGEREILLLSEQKFTLL